MKSLIGRKLGMTRIFTKAGESVPVTILEVGPNVVYQVKTLETDGYSAIQVGFGQQKSQRLNLPEKSHFAKAKKGFPLCVREFRLDQCKREGDNGFNVGDTFTLGGMFDAGNKVDVVGTSIGKGFAGVIKRHGMHGFNRTHGTHEYFRHGGSIGNRKFPGRVFKNKRMPGHMGCDRVLQENIEVVEVRLAENLMLLKGSVPGAKDSFVVVRESVKHS